MQPKISPPSEAEQARVILLRVAHLIIIIAECLLNYSNFGPSSRILFGFMVVYSNGAALVIEMNYVLWFWVLVGIGFEVGRCEVLEKIC